MAVWVLVACSASLNHLHLYIYIRVYIYIYMYIYICMYIIIYLLACISWHDCYIAHSNGTHAGSDLVISSCGFICLLLLHSTMQVLTYICTYQRVSFINWHQKYSTIYSTYDDYHCMAATCWWCFLPAHKVYSTCTCVISTGWYWYYIYCAYII